MNDEELFVRREYAVAISREHEFLVSTPGAEPSAIPGLDGTSGSQLWQALASPASRAELAETSGLAASELQSSLDVLSEADAVGSARAEPRAPEAHEATPDTRPCGRLVLGVCGCAQAVLTPELVRQLLAGFARHLDVILTTTAQRLVSLQALETMGARVWTDTWQTSPESPVPHIEMARSAEMVLVLPASARSLSSLAHTTCEDLLGLVVTATRSPIVLVPSMNSAMWTNPGVQENASRCRRLGMTVIEPGLARSLSDERTKKIVGGVGVGPATPGIARLLARLMRAERHA